MWYQTLVAALSRWRVAIAQMLQHQALLKLRHVSLTQQQTLATLRKGPPGGAPHVGPAAAVERRKVFESDDQPQKRLLLKRILLLKRLLSLSNFLSHWKLFVVADTGRHSGQTWAVTHAVGAAQVRLKRAGAQEAALAGLRAECAALRERERERERQLALAQKQLAAAVDRRRVVESDGKQAQELLSRWQVEQGRARAAREGLAAAQEGEIEWRGEAARAVRERHMLARELEHEERAAKWARELVLSCHGALLEAQQAQRRHVAQLTNERRSGFNRVAEAQAAMIADMRALEASLRKAMSDKAMRTQAKKRGALAATTTTMTTTTTTTGRESRACGGDNGSKGAVVAERSRKRAWDSDGEMAIEPTEVAGPAEPSEAAPAAEAETAIAGENPIGSTPATLPRGLPSGGFGAHSLRKGSGKAAAVSTAVPGSSNVGVDIQPAEQSGTTAQGEQLRAAALHRLLRLRRLGPLLVAWQHWEASVAMLLVVRRQRAIAGHLEASRAEERRAKAQLAECRKRLATEKARADRLEAIQGNGQLASRRLELQVTQLQQRLHMSQSTRKAATPLAPPQPGESKANKQAAKEDVRPPSPPSPPTQPPQLAQPSALAAPHSPRHRMTPQRQNGAGNAAGNDAARLPQPRLPPQRDLPLRTVPAPSWTSPTAAVEGWVASHAEPALPSTADPLSEADPPPAASPTLDERLGGSSVSAEGLERLIEASADYSDGAPSSAPPRAPPRAPPPAPSHASSVLPGTAPGDAAAGSTQPPSDQLPSGDSKAARIAAARARAARVLQQSAD